MNGFVITLAVMNVNQTTFVSVCRPIMSTKQSAANMAIDWWMFNDI